MAVTPADIIAFWRDAGPDRWFAADPAFDAEVTRRFEPLYVQAAAGGLAPWQNSDEGMLALILVLDQFPRNMFRGDARSFATDAAALALARDAIAAAVDVRTAEDLRAFVYMPLMHSEDARDQRRCVQLFEAFGNPDNLKFARLHEDIIARFGRFPHRNRVLGRLTTPQEQAFLDSGGFSG